MLGSDRGETSPVPSAESTVHSSNPPSTRGPDGTMPRYPTVRAPGFSRRPTTPAPIPKGWRGGQPGGKRPPLAAEESPTTGCRFVFPPPVLISWEEDLTSHAAGPCAARGDSPTTTPK